jgi:hypothetical protein
LEDLNKCLSTMSYAGRLYAKALAGELAPQQLVAPTPSRRNSSP